MHCGSCMSRTGTASQDLETACSVTKISLLLQQLKPLYVLWEAYLLLLLIGIHESKEKCAICELNLSSLGTMEFMFQGKFLYKFRHFSLVVTICIMLTFTVIILKKFRSLYFVTQLLLLIHSSALRR